MSRPNEPEGTPDLAAVESDFTVPDDADLRPVHGDDAEAPE